MLTGWLSPEGKYHPCPYFGHMAAADYIVEHQYPDARYIKPVDDMLIQDFGWIKIYHCLGSGNIFGYSKHLITEEQRHFIKNDYENNPRDYDIESRYDLDEMNIVPMND